MHGTADDRYFEWLYSHIGPVNYDNPGHTYWSMAKQFHTTKFTWFVRNDANRAEDGLLLREAFIDKWGDEGVTVEWLTLDCSILEMLIALSDRLAFESYGGVADWFWQLMSNLGLQRYTDRYYNQHNSGEIAEVLQRVLDRTYGYDGSGGLFPLREATRDQRKVELWYQKEAYLLEGLRVNNGPRV